MRRVIGRGAVIAAALGATALSAQGAGDSERRSPQLPEAGACAPADAANTTVEAAAPPPLLIDGLGYAGIEADTDHPEAQAWFAQGVRLVWAFDEAEAIRSFEQAQRLDPDCAMCFWGEAWARGPTINLQPRTEELDKARVSAARAVALSGRLGPRDQWLVRAMRLRTAGETDFRNEEYAGWMETGALRFPGDDVLAVMAADARMVTHGRDFEQGSLAQRLLERVLGRNPDHSGAIHFYIHLTDWIDRQDLAERYADRLGRLAPSASHLVHMPSHTFYGIGRYADAASVNVAALAVDRSYEERVRPPPTAYRSGLYTHNMHFAINSALMRNDGATALAIADHFRAKFGDQAEAEGGRRVIRSAIWYAQGLHAPVAEMLAIREQENSPLARALRHYARGEALARAGDAAAIRAEAAAIERLRTGTDAPGLGSGVALKLVELAQKVLEGRASMVEGNFVDAAFTYRAAMALQAEANFSSDPPLFWYPVRRSLGAALLASGDHESAREQFRATLRKWPNDPLALYGLARAEQALGDGPAAARSLARARAGWIGAIEEMPLSRI